MKAKIVNCEKKVSQKGNTYYQVMIDLGEEYNNKCGFTLSGKEFKKGDVVELVPDFDYNHNLKIGIK